MKVGYLGPRGTFSYEACNDYYNNNETKIKSRPAKTILGEYIFWIDVKLYLTIKEKMRL